MNRIWVVEMWNPLRGRFEPTVASALTKKECGTKRRDWSHRNPTDRFRVRRYDAKVVKGRR